MVLLFLCPISIIYHTNLTFHLFWQKDQDLLPTICISFVFSSEDGNRTFCFLDIHLPEVEWPLHFNFFGHTPTSWAVELNYSLISWNITIIYSTMEAHQKCSNETKGFLASLSRSFLSIFFLIIITLTGTWGYFIELYFLGDWWHWEFCFHMLIDCVFL